MRIGTRLRKKAREMYEEHKEVYGLRYMVESWIGAVKELSGKSIEMAKKAVWVYNENDGNVQYQEKGGERYESGGRHTVALDDSSCRIRVNE